jgi:hypothetical protein
MTATLTRPTTSTAAVTFPRGRWAALAVLLTGQFMGLIDALIVNVALPLIGSQLNITATMLQLVVGATSPATRSCSWPAPASAA